MSRITTLQTFQSPVSRKRCVEQLRSWYHSVRRHTGKPFTAVVVQISGKVETIRYRDGAPVSTDRKLPNTGDFSGYVVGNGTSDNFQPFAITSPDGLPLKTSLLETFKQLKTWGFTLPTCDFSSEPGVSSLEGRLDTYKGKVLLCMDDLESAADLASRGRRVVGMLEGSSEYASPTREVSIEEAPKDLPKEDPQPTQALTSTDGDNRPVAILTGGFSKPHAAYYSQIYDIGHQVVDSKGMETLPPEVKLVVHPTANRKTKLVEEAQEKGIRTLTAPQLNEASRSARAAAGKTQF